MGYQHIKLGYDPFGNALKRTAVLDANGGTGTAILTPTAGKLWVITRIILSVSADATNVSLFDNTNVVANLLFFGDILVAGNSTVVIDCSGAPYRSSAADNVLKMTSTITGDISVTLQYWEE